MAMKKYLFILTLVACAGYTLAQSAAQQRCSSFKRGMNLSNWLEAPWQPNWPAETGYTKSDLQNMKDAGIKSIRLPINFAEITDTAYPFTIDTADVLFQRIDSVIKWTDELQLNLIIDNHHGWPLTNENWRNYKDRFANMWATVIKKYRHLDPDHYFFELLNEPPIPFNDQDSLNLLFYTALDSIRSYTTEHSIIVSPTLGSWGMAFDLYQPLTDTNLIYTFHYYDPIDFTHQGFIWHDPFYPAGIAFPDPNASFYTQFVTESWRRLATWKSTYNKPVFLGEFGVSKHADATSRCNWAEFTGHKIDSVGVPWFYWDWRWDFSIFNSNTVSEDSVIDCFKYALHLYNDTISAINETELCDIRLFPNPLGSSGMLSIESCDNADNVFTIYDAMGRIVFNENSKGVLSYLRPSLEKGYYMVIINSGNKRTYKKLLVTD